MSEKQLKDFKKTIEDWKINRYIALIPTKSSNIMKISINNIHKNADIEVLLIFTLFKSVFTGENWFDFISLFADISYIFPDSDK